MVKTIKLLAFLLLVNICFICIAAEKPLDQENLTKTAINFSVYANTPRKKNDEIIELVKESTKTLEDDGWELYKQSFADPKVPDEVLKSSNSSELVELLKYNEKIPEIAEVFLSMKPIKILHPDNEKILKAQKLLKSEEKNLLEQHYGYATGKKVIDGKNVYVIAFRGTHDLYSLLLTDLLQASPSMNFENTGAQVHRGFELCRQAALKQEKLNSFIEKIKNDKSDPIVLVTGHSLGAGMATLQAAAFVENNIVSSENLHLITFAEPPCGKSSFNNIYKQKIPNYSWWTNLYDPVPVAPVLVSFLHMKWNKRILFNSKKPVIDEELEQGLIAKTVFGRHDIRHYKNAVYNHNW